MIDGVGGPGDLPAEVRASGWKPGKKKGWAGMRRGHIVAYRPAPSKQLAFARVLRNDRAAESAEVRVYRSIWEGTCVKRLPLYLETAAEGGRQTLTPGTEPAKAVVFYIALVKVVELLGDCRMMQGDSSDLAKGGWALRMNEHDLQLGIVGALRFLAEDENVLKADTEVAVGVCCTPVDEIQSAEDEGRLSQVGAGALCFQSENGHQGFAPCSAAESTKTNFGSWLA
jgi:hypothetical protein